MTCLLRPCSSLHCWRRAADHLAPTMRSSSYSWEGARSAGGVAASCQPDAAGHLMLTTPATMTTEVKKSKFITLAWPVERPKEAMELIASASDPGATHNCWAWQIGEDSRSSDDGEPSGTAGRPILAAIQGEGLDYTCVLVIRYYGGTKLGTGGLVRAYGGAARECLRGAPKHFCRSKATLDLELDFKQLALVYGQLDRWGARRLGEEMYTEGGLVQVAVELDSDKEVGFISMVTDLTAGAFVPKRREQIRQR